MITRDVTLERTTDFPTSGPFQVASLNTELDKIIAMMADLNDLAGRGIQLADSDTAVSVILPNVTGRAGKVLAFNSSTGAVEAGPTITDTQTVDKYLLIFLQWQVYSKRHNSSWNKCKCNNCCRNQLM